MKSFGIDSSNRNFSEFFCLENCPWLILLMIILFLLFNRKLECPADISQSSIFMPACYYIQKKHLNFAGQASDCFFMGRKLGLLTAVSDCVLVSSSNGFTQCVCCSSSAHASGLSMGFFSLTYTAKHTCCVFATHTYIPESICVGGRLCICQHFISLHITNGE